MRKIQLVALILPAILVLTMAQAARADEVLPWRPDCQNMTGPFLSSWNYAGDQKLCYVNATTFFVQMDLYTNFAGQLFKPTNPDAYIEGINYWNPAGPNSKVGNMNLTFEYYYPYYPDGRCPVDPTNINAATGFYNNPQLVLVGDTTASFATGSGTFNDALHQFNVEANCGQWRTFNHKLSDFANDWGSSFSHNNRDIGSVSFEVSNVYIRNVNLIGTATPPVKQVW